MALVVNEREFSQLMASLPLDKSKKWLGLQFKTFGKKPLPQKTRFGEDVVVIFGDTIVSMRGKSFYLEEIFRNHNLGVYVNVSDDIDLSALILQYDLGK